MPACGPHGVPWLLVTYDMPDHTAKLRLTNLTTGTTTLLLTVGRESLAEDGPDEEEEEGSGSETGEHSAEAGPGSNAAPAAAPEHPEPDAELAMQGQPSMGAAMQAAPYLHRQTDDPEQPSAQLEPGLQHNATIDEEPPVVSDDHYPAHPEQSPCSAKSSTPLDHPRPILQGPDSAGSAAVGIDLQPAPATHVPAIDVITPATYAETCSHVSGSDGLPQDAAPHPPEALSIALDQPQAGPLLGHAPRGLGLKYKIQDWQFLEDGRHVFLEGTRVDSASEASFWQVLSIPEGQTTALARVPHGIYEKASLIGARWVIAKTPTSVLVFHMATLQLCCTIDLQQILRRVANADLVPGSLRHGHFTSASKKRMAVEVNSRCSSSGSISTSVLVFDDQHRAPGCTLQPSSPARSQANAMDSPRAISHAGHQTLHNCRPSLGGPHDESGLKSDRS